jgi:hypothetical protein
MGIRCVGLFDDQPNARVHTTEVTSVDLGKHSSHRH